MCARLEPSAAPPSALPNIFSPSTAGPQSSVGERGGLFAATRATSQTMPRRTPGRGGRRAPGPAWAAGMRIGIALSVTAVIACVLVVAWEDDSSPVPGRHVEVRPQAKTPVPGPSRERRQRAQTRRRARPAAPRRRVSRRRHSHATAPVSRRTAMRTRTPGRPAARGPRAAAAPVPVPRPASSSGSGRQRRPTPVPVAAPPEFL